MLRRPGMRTSPENSPAVSRRISSPRTVGMSGSGVNLSLLPEGVMRPPRSALSREASRDNSKEGSPSASPFRTDAPSARASGSGSGAAWGAAGAAPVDPILQAAELLSGKATRSGWQKGGQSALAVEAAAGARRGRPHPARPER